MIRGVSKTATLKASADSTLAADIRAVCVQQTCAKEAKGKQAKELRTDNPYTYLLAHALRAITRRAAKMNV